MADLTSLDPEQLPDAGIPATHYAPVQNPSPGEGAGGLNSDHLASRPDTRLPYVPQFSATTSFILSRMKKTDGGLNSALSAISATGLQPDKQAYEDAKTRLVQTMNGSTMPLPTTQASVVSSSLSTLNSFMNGGTKRKRESDVEKVDFSQNTISFPTSTQLPQRRAPVAAATEDSRESESSQCTVCGLHSSSPSNIIVTCSRCLGSWHQQCATPQISSEACRSGNFECAGCNSAPLEHSEDYQRRLHRIERIREKRLANLPRGIVPAKPELVGFGAGQSSDYARSEYFYSKKKTDLLNILSFCDQLKPQLLVDLLVSVSKRHPDLPIFDSPDWQSQLPATDSSEPTLSTSKPRLEHKQRHGHNLVTQKMRQKQRNSKKIVKPSRALQLDAGVVYEKEDSLPPTWHKAGEGLYAKLVPEVEDRSFLVDDNDEEAFSHFMVDGSGKQIIEAA